MADSVPIPVAAPAQARTVARVAAVPWYAWTMVLASASAVIGAIWDASWHMSIGRDTFWTPAHLAIQFCAVLGCLTCLYLILATTFGSDASAKAASVGVLGFRGPLGAFLAAWGGVAMLTSAPFDNWWHNAYGLDVKILSPPHALLGIGAFMGQLGGLTLILGAMNRAQGRLRERLNWLFLFAGGLVLAQIAFFSIEYLLRIFIHSAIFYRAAAIGFPFVLIGVARASGRRWATTAVAASYTAIWAGMVWILPLFPAEPKLGPVYFQVTHLVFPHFPLLVIVPAIALDLLRPRLERWDKWRQAAVLGAMFLLALLAVQWPFASFLMTPASRNWLFATRDLPYFAKPNFAMARHVFLSWEATRAEFWRGMLIALGSAILSARLGLAWGDWMRTLRR